jgi:hypothetical protein
MHIEQLKITFKENSDVHYFFQIKKLDSEVIKHIIDYPIDKIEIDDDDSLFPLLTSKLPNGNTLIEIDEDTSIIYLKYIKKGFLQNVTAEFNTVNLRYYEKIEINLTEKNQSFWLSIQSPFSYISAIRKKSTALFNNQYYAPGDLSPFACKESGILEIDWELEIIQEKKLLYEKEVQLNKEKITNKYFNQKEPYLWLDELNDRFFRDDLRHLTERILHLDIEQILNESCFYLSSGADITPIIAFQDKIRSFIYCDLYCYDGYPNIDNRLMAILIKLKNRLNQQEFREVQMIKIDKRFLKIEDIRYSDGSVSKMAGAELSIWEKDNKFYSLIYINWDNSEAYKSLYVNNKLMPKAICEILPEGGSIGKHSIIKIPYKYRMPEYSIGHNYSIGNCNDYELISDKIEYFGDYGPEFGSNYGKNLYKKK